MSNVKNGIKQVNVTELKELVQSPNNDQVIIDVREPFEYKDGHIPGVPLLPMNMIPYLLEGFDREKEYVFVCRSGNRSQHVSLFLKERGINVVNYDGGMLEWDGELVFGSEHEIKTVEELKDWEKINHRIFSRLRDVSLSL